MQNYCGGGRHDVWAINLMKDVLMTSANSILVNRFMEDPNLKVYYNKYEYLEE